MPERQRHGSGRQTAPLSGQSQPWNTGEPGLAHGHPQRAPSRQSCSRARTNGGYQAKEMS